MSKQTQGKTLFQTSSVADERFKLRLKTVSKPNEAICSLCNSTNNNVNGCEKLGVGALDSHTKGAKHQDRVSGHSLLSGI